MSYRIHKYEIKMEKDLSGLEDYLNNLTGELVEIIPNYARTTLFQIYSLTSKIDFLVIVERI